MFRPSKYLPMLPPRRDLRKGVIDSVVLMISTRQVGQQDLASVRDGVNRLSHGHEACGIRPLQTSSRAWPPRVSCPWS